jgi:hypothetical protein
MGAALPLILTAAKMSTVMPVAWAITVLGGVGFGVGWLWLVYQNWRFGTVHGVLSLIPLYALVFAFARLEHAQKAVWTALFLAGFVVSMLGYTLVFSADDCENNPDCAATKAQQTSDSGSDDSGSGSSIQPPEHPGGSLATAQ